MPVLTNYSNVKQEMRAKLQVNIPFQRAEFCAIDGVKEVSVQGNELTITNMTDGGLLVLR